MDDARQLPSRLYELALQGSKAFKKRARRNAVQFWLAAAAAVVVGVANFDGLNPIVMFVVAGIFVFLAMFMNAGVSLEPANDVADGLLEQQVVLILHFPPRQSGRMLQFMRGPKERWSILLPTSEAGELLTLLSLHAPSIPIRPYDGPRMRQWMKDWESQPWRETAAGPGAGQR